MSRIIDLKTNNVHYIERSNPSVAYGSLDTPMSALDWFKAIGMSLALFSCFTVLTFLVWVLG